MGARADRQESLLRFAQETLDARGCLPLPQEAASKVGMSVRTAYRQLDRLARERGMEPPRALRRLSEQERERIVKDVSGGSTVAQAATRFGVGQNTVRRALREAGVAPGQSVSKGYPKDAGSISTREVIRRFMTSGHGREHLSHRQIADALRLKPSTVSYHLQRIRQEALAGADVAEATPRPPRGEAFIANCRALIEGAARGGVPLDQRRLVVSLCLPVLHIDKQASSPHLVLAVPSAVAYHHLRHGTPATVGDIADLLPQHPPRAVREAARRCRAMMTLDAVGDGYVPVGPDPSFTPALMLSRSGTKGWSETLLRARSAVLDVVLHDSRARIGS